MTDFALSGFWFFSIFVALAVGWLVGWHVRVLADIACRTEVGEVGELASARACPLAAAKGVPKVGVPTAGLPTAGLPKAGLDAALASDIRPQTRSVAWPSSHVFDNMPPVETVRAQAKSILKTESVWDAQSLRDSPDASESMAKARVIRVGSRVYHAPIIPWGTPEITQLCRRPKIRTCVSNDVAVSGPYRGVD